VRQAVAGENRKIPPTLCVAIFSFNRGVWLFNAVSSLALLQASLPQAAVQVYDDGSDDTATLAVLANLPVKVISTRQREEMARHGGLYAHMQTAFETAAEGSLLLCMQDDTQVVRPVDALDLDVLEQGFAQHPRLAFISPSFVRGRRALRFRRSFHPATAGLCFSRLGNDRDVPRNCYTDVVIAHVDRLRAAGWRFKGSEHDNAKQARELFGPMAVMAAPFVAAQPEAAFFRHRRRPFVARLLRRLAPAAFVPQTPDEVAQLRQRPPDQPAIAEDWLRCTRPVRRPFVYKDVQSSYFLAGLYAIERALRKVF
jgi:hypothetical protein